MPKKPPIVTDPQSCASCRFYQPNQNDEYGFCRRYPPVPVLSDDATSILWPITAMPEWCGEYTRKLHS